VTTPRRPSPLHVPDKVGIGGMPIRPVAIVADTISRAWPDAKPPPSSRSAWGKRHSVAQARGFELDELRMPYVPLTTARFASLKNRETACLDAHPRRCAAGSPPSCRPGRQSVTTHHRAVIPTRWTRRRRPGTSARRVG
jgi:hypothetical protein